MPHVFKYTLKRWVWKCSKWKHLAVVVFPSVLLSDHIHFSLCVVLSRIQKYIGLDILDQNHSIYLSSSLSPTQHSDRLNNKSDEGSSDHISMEKVSRADVSPDLLSTLQTVLNPWEESLPCIYLRRLVSVSSYAALPKLCHISIGTWFNVYPQSRPSWFISEFIFTHVSQDRSSTLCIQPLSKLVSKCITKQMFTVWC